MTFKLIAIRPLARCDKKFLRVLKPKIAYSFYKNYDYSLYTDKNKRVSITISELPNIYSIIQGRKLINIQVSALVGENGSGKSTLAELFYVACYNLAVLKGVLFNETTEMFLGSKDIVKNINLELFYEMDEEFRMLQLKGNIFTCYKHDGASFHEDAETEFDFKDFFYTISINYSLHSLNAEVLGDWVEKIFHKNDGYRTPIVLNPYRTSGVIDINNEEYLVKSRLISNILGRISRDRKPEESLRNIINNKIAYRLHVKLRRSKFKYKKDGSPNFETTEKYGKRILPRVYHYFLNDGYFRPKETLLNGYAQEYILNKLINIASKYDPYRRLMQFFYQEGGELEAYLRMLSEDKSHITFKLVQALNFLSNDLYINRKETFDLTIRYLSDVLEKESTKKSRALIDILPPAFFEVDIEFQDAGFFNELSSGEKQRIYSISTMLYHLNNVNSTNTKIALYKYRSVNVIFDELELYFHPEMQRTLLFDILENLKRLELRDIESINMLFITHSPFILSDIPSQNTLILGKGGLPLAKGLEQQTFGANIFDLLKNKFFLENGPMGEVARNYIDKTISWLTDEKRDMNLTAYHKSMIAMIGEPVLQRKLAEMYDEITREQTEIDFIRKDMALLGEMLKQAENRRK